MHSIIVLTILLLFRVNPYFGFELLARFFMLLKFFPHLLVLSLHMVDLLFPLLDLQLCGLDLLD